MNLINIPMNEEEIKGLIEKYYNGESTDPEEALLRDYFNQDDIPAGYEAEKAIFRYFSEPVSVPEPSSDFENRIQAGVDEAAGTSRQLRARRYILPFISAAASLLILLGSYFFLIRRSESLGTYKDPDIAYAETMKILMEVSYKLNQGTSALKPVGKINTMTVKSLETFSKSQQMIEKNLKNLEYLQTAVEITNPSENK
jgi:hypothetical protein